MGIAVRVDVELIQTLMLFGRLEAFDPGFEFTGDDGQLGVSQLPDHLQKP